MLTDRLFVYGTLRAGYNNEPALALAGSAHRLGAARIQGRLYRVSTYPAIALPQSDSDWVEGDLFEGVLPALLEMLDEYEGAEYRRQIAQVILEGTCKLSAYVYFYLPAVAQLEWIPSGDWLQFSLAPAQPE